MNRMHSSTTATLNPLKRVWGCRQNEKLPIGNKGQKYEEFSRIRFSISSGILHASRFSSLLCRPWYSAQVKDEHGEDSSYSTTCFFHLICYWYGSPQLPFFNVWKGVDHCLTVAWRPSKWSSTWNLALKSRPAPYGAWLFARQYRMLYTDVTVQILASHSVRHEVMFASHDVQGSQRTNTSWNSLRGCGCSTTRVDKSFPCFLSWRASISTNVRSSCPWALREEVYSGE